MTEQTTAPLELAPEGYGALNASIERLERIVNEGIANPEKALDCCREIRTELYRILQTLRNVCVITQNADEEDPDGEAA